MGAGYPTRTSTAVVRVTYVNDELIPLRMKRYEERLLEDMQSREWQILLNPCPSIYNLPNELLILIFGFVEGMATLCSVRRVSRRFNQLAMTLMFKTLYMDEVRPSRMTLLPWTLKQRPRWLGASHSLKVRMCGSMLTLHYPSRIPTTRDQDVSQAEVISSMPGLRILSISLGQFIDIIYPHSVTTQSLGAMGFSRTLEALSQAINLRELYLITSANGGSRFFLLDLFISVGERLEKLSIQRGILAKVLQLINRTETSNDGFRFPVLCNLVHLSLDLHYLTDHEFLEMSLMLSHHLPRLATLECNCNESGAWWVDDAVRLIMMNPIQTLIIKGCPSVHHWMVSIPTKAIELRFHDSHACGVMLRLADLIKSQLGAFGSEYVETIRLIIDTSIITLPSRPISHAPSDPVGDFTPESALQLLKDACVRGKIILLTP